jgi:hypothetical protein
MLNPTRTSGPSAPAYASITATACSNRRRRLNSPSLPVLSPCPEKSKAIPRQPWATNSRTSGSSRSVLLVPAPCSTTAVAPDRSPPYTPLSRSPSWSCVKSKSMPPIHSRRGLRLSGVSPPVSDPGRHLFGDGTVGVPRATGVRRLRRAASACLVRTKIRVRSMPSSSARINAKLSGSAAHSAVGRPVTASAQVGNYVTLIMKILGNYVTADSRASLSMNRRSTCHPAGQQPHLCKI